LIPRHHVAEKFSFLAVEALERGFDNRIVLAMAREKADPGRQSLRLAAWRA